MRYAALAFLLSGALIVGGCANRFAVTHIQEIPKAPNVKPDTVLYSLPRTVVTAQVTVTKTTKQPGIFAPWVDLFVAALGAKPGDVTRQEEVSIKAKSAAISQSSEPDPENVYSVAVKGTLWEQIWQDRNGTMKFNSQGVLTSGQITLTNTAPDTILSLASLASGVVNRTVLAPVGGGEPTNEEIKEIACEAEITPDETAILKSFSEVGYLPQPGQDQQAFCQLRNHGWGNNMEDLKKAVPEYALSVAAAGKDVTATPKDLSKVVLLRQALAEYRAMVTITLSLTGAIQTAPSPKEVQSTFNAILESQRQDYLGSSSPEDWTPAFIYRPPSRPPQPSGAPVTPVFLFSYDPAKGICTVDRNQQREGIQIPDNWQVSPCAELRRVTLRVACPEGVAASGNGCDDIAQHSGLAVKPAKGVRGFPYRQPAPRLIQIFDGKKEKARAVATIAQFGPVLTLPSSLGGFSTDYAAAFDESTGALTSLNFGSKAAVNKGMVDSASTLATGTLDARKKQLDSVKAQADKAAQSNSVGGELDRRKALLQNQADYLAACAAAGCNVHSWSAQMANPSLNNMGSLNFTCEPYSPNYWCWASVTEAVHRFYAGGGPSICGIVNWQLNRSDCCGTGPGGICDVPCDLESSLRAADCLQNGVTSAIAPNLIRGQLSVRRPVGAFIEWNPNRPGHFVVIAGIEPNNALWIIDPQTGPTSPQSWDYLAFRDRYRDIGHWRATYFTKPPSNGGL